MEVGFVIRAQLQLWPKTPNGGSPLLQQREATLQRCGKEFDFNHAL
jgi:hypothetical protein